MEVTSDDSFGAQQGELSDVNEIMKHNAVRGLPIEDDDIDKRHCGHVSCIRKDAVAAGAKFFVKRGKRDFSAGFQAINNPGAVENVSREEGTKACLLGAVERSG